MLFKSDRHQYAWFRPGQAYNNKFVKKMIKHGDGKIMVWVCIMGQGIGRLHKIEGIMQALDYIKIIKDQLLGTLKDLKMCWTGNSEVISNRTMIPSTYQSLPGSGSRLTRSISCCGYPLALIWTSSSMFGTSWTALSMPRTHYHATIGKYGRLCKRNGLLSQWTDWTTFSRVCLNMSKPLWRLKVAIHSTEMIWSKTVSIHVSFAIVSGDCDKQLIRSKVLHRGFPTFALISLGIMCLFLQNKFHCVAAIYAHIAELKSNNLLYFWMHSIVIYRKHSTCAILM